MSHKDNRRLDVLRKRAAFLEMRVAGSPINLTYDKAEAAALRWAIALIVAALPHSQESPHEANARQPR